MIGVRCRHGGGDLRRESSQSTATGKSAVLMAMMVVAVLLSACTPALLAPDERKQMCTVRVDDKFGTPAFHANPLSNPAGAVVGAGAGALAGIGPGAIFVVPIGAAVGAAYGAACGAASLGFPAADADFQAILRSADAGSLKRALEAQLNAPRDGCARPAADAAGAMAPDTIVEIRSVVVTMGCLFGHHEYWVVVKWGVMSAPGLKVLAEPTTTCSHKSGRPVGEWFAKPDEAKAEVERVLGKIGERMAAELLSPVGLSECKL
jgi:hypothetical protein